MHTTVGEPVYSRLPGLVMVRMVAVEGVVLNVATEGGDGDEDSEGVLEMRVLRMAINVSGESCEVVKCGERGEGRESGRSGECDGGGEGGEGSAGDEGDEKVRVHSGLSSRSSSCSQHLFLVLVAGEGAVGVGGVRGCGWCCGDGGVGEEVWTQVVAVAALHRFCQHWR
jgi:hypothetical protein